jgi:hypothetical protein
VLFDVDADVRCSAKALRTKCQKRGGSSAYRYLCAYFLLTVLPIHANNVSKQAVGVSWLPSLWPGYLFGRRSGSEPRNPLCLWPSGTVVSTVLFYLSRLFTKLQPPSIPLLISYYLSRWFYSAQRTPLYTNSLLSVVEYAFKP